MRLRMLSLHEKYLSAKKFDFEKLSINLFNFWKILIGLGYIGRENLAHYAELWHHHRLDAEKQLLA